MEGHIIDNNLIVICCNNCSKSDKCNNSKKYDVEECVSDLIGKKIVNILNNRIMSYSEIYDFFNYLVNKSDLIDEFLYLTNEDYGTNVYELLDYINKIEPIECRVGFLQGLTSDCRKNKVDLYGEMMYFQDGNGFIYFMNNEQITREFIIPIASNRDFILPSHIGVKLLEILEG